MEDSNPRVRPRRRRLVAALVALSLLAAFEFGVARTKWAYELTPGIFIGSIYALEDNVIEPGPEPQVVLFGSSRLQDGVAPRILEKDLGLPAGSVMNLAFPFGDVVAARILYQRNREKLGKAGIVVIAVEMWDLFGERELDPAEEFFLSMEERLQRSGKDRVSLLVSSVWKTYALRKMSGHILGGIMGGGPARGPLASDGRLQYFDGSQTGPETIDAAAQFDDRFLDLEQPDGMAGGGSRVELQRFIDMLVADGAEVVVVHLPMRRDFMPEVEQRLPTLVEKVRQILADLDGPALVQMETTLDVLGIPDTSYRDFGHAAEAAVEPITSYIASLIRSVGGGASTR